MSTSAALFGLVATTVVSQVEQLPPPKHPHQPFRIFVFSEPHGEPAAVARVHEAEKECHKILKRRKKWFISTNDRQEAEIVMEIKASWTYEQMTMEWYSGTPTNITREDHYLFAEVTILGGRFGLRAEGRRSVKVAASMLMDALEEFCKKNYWEILERRHNSPQIVSSWPHNKLRILVAREPRQNPWLN